MQPVSYFWQTDDLIELPYTEIFRSGAEKCVRVEGDDIDLWALVCADKVNFDDVRFPDSPIHAYRYGGFEFMESHISGNYRNNSSRGRGLPSQENLPKDQATEIIDYFIAFAPIADRNDLAHMFKNVIYNDINKAKINQLIRVPNTFDDLGKYCLTSPSTLKEYKYVSAVVSIMSGKPDAKYSDVYMELYKTYWYLAKHETMPNSVYNPISTSTKIKSALLKRDQKAIQYEINSQIKLHGVNDSIRDLVITLYKSGLMDLTSDVYTSRHYIRVNQKNKARLEKDAIEIKNKIAVVSEFKSEKYGVDVFDIGFNEIYKTFGYKHVTDSITWATNDGTLEDFKYFKRYGINRDYDNMPMAFQYLLSIVPELRLLSEDERDKYVDFILNNYAKNSLSRQHIYFLNVLLGDEPKNSELYNYVASKVQRMGIDNDFSEFSRAVHMCTNTMAKLIIQYGIINAHPDNLLSNSVISEIRGLFQPDEIDTSTANKYLLFPSNEKIIDELKFSINHVYDRLQVFEFYSYITTSNKNDYDGMIDCIQQAFPQFRKLLLEIIGRSNPRYDDLYSMSLFNKYKKYDII